MVLPKLGDLVALRHPLRIISKAVICDQEYLIVDIVRFPELPELSDLATGLPGIALCDVLSDLWIVMIGGKQYIIPTVHLHVVRRFDGEKNHRDDSERSNCIN